jgi:hypothetical protein
MCSLTRAAVIMGLALVVFVPWSSGATGDRTFATAGAITRLAADGPRVAALTTKIKGSCDRVVVWNGRNGRSTSFATREACPHTDVAVIPFRVAELALGDGQIAWIASTGGNETETLVYAARLTGRKAKEIDFLTSDSTSGEGDDAQHLFGGGSVLAYNRELGCEQDANGGFSCDVRLVRIRGGRGNLVASRGTLVGAGGTRLATTSAGGTALLRPDGSTVASLGPAPSRTRVAVGGTRVGVQSAGALDVYDATAGSKLTSVALGAAGGLELVGVNAKLALFRGSGRTALMRLGDGKVVQLTLKGVVDARLTEDGLFYAYNTPKATRKGHVAFRPTVKLLRSF